MAGADGVSLTSLSVSGPQVIADGAWARQLDELQYVEHEGPCLDAARTGAMFRVRDIGGDTRWPSYPARALEHGALGMVSLPMTVESKTIGALNVYSRRSDAFSAEAVCILEIAVGQAGLAAQVAATLHGHRDLAANLRTALASRATIEQAKGIVMGTVGCGAEAAFELLVQQSQHQNRKLRDIADELVARHSR